MPLWLAPIVLLAAGAGAADGSSLRVYRDWIVGCDNGLSCMAVGLLPRDGDDFAVIEVTRSADADAEPMVEVLDVPQSTAALVAGAMHLPVTRDRHGEIVVAGRDLPALLQAARSEPAMQLVDGAGAVVGHVSLAGAAAALLYMDVAQHRLGTVTALARPGTLPAGSIAAPPPLPLAHKAPGSPRPPAWFGAVVAARLRGDAACKPGSGRQDEPPTFHRLDASHTLALVPTICVSGAYNIYTDAYVFTDGRAEPEPARFGQFPGDTHDGDDTSGANVAWDAAARVLHTGMLGRGMGDCGLWHDYVWDGRGFRPAERREMGECRGGMDAITTWRARIVR